MIDWKDELDADCPSCGRQFDNYDDAVEDISGEVVIFECPACGLTETVFID